MRRAVRERAMLLLQLAANHDGTLRTVALWTGDASQGWRDGDSEALSVAIAARVRMSEDPVVDESDNAIDWYGTTCLEAEAALRDGWSP